MNDVLNRVFAKPTGVPVDGVVSSRKGNNLWAVTDRLGRVFIAKSTEDWRLGIDWVTVQDGRIIDRAKRRGPIKEYKV